MPLDGCEDFFLLFNRLHFFLLSFYRYILFEIPSNVILKRLKPHVWLSICMFMFGLVTICQGLVQGYGGLLTTRFFLGVFEAGMFPGSFYLIGMWYKRHEAQKRYTFFFASTTLAGAFGGLLASAIGKMDGTSKTMPNFKVSILTQSHRHAGVSWLEMDLYS